MVGAGARNSEIRMYESPDSFTHINTHIHTTTIIIIITTTTTTHTRARYMLTTQPHQNMK